MRKKRISIQKKLFNKYVALIISVAVVFLTIIYIFYLNELSERSEEMLRRMAVSIANEFEMKFQKIDSLQKRIFYSEKMEEILFAEPDQYIDAGKKQELYKELEQLTNLVCGPDDSDYQINYWNRNGGCVGVGHNRFIDYQPDKIDSDMYLRESLQRKGEKMIVRPRKAMWGEKEVVIIPMFRTLEKTGTDEKVIIEIQVSCDSLEKSIRKNLDITEEDERKYSILVYNQKQHRIFASDELENDIKFYDDVVKKYIENVGGEKREAEIGNITRRLYKEYSEFLDWNIWVFENENIYMQPMIDMTFLLLFITFIILLCLWMVTKKLTQELVSPIMYIHKKMTNLDLQKLNEIQNIKIEGNIKELIELDDAFEQMCRQLKESKDKLELSYVKEVQSKLLAMQSQMNPHFLFNVLSIIKIMGMEADRQEIVEVCTELSMMLRYVSSSDSSLVKIRQEKEYTLNYLKLMSVRFQEYLEYEVDIPEAMNQIKLPRLVLQPLVENSIKYITEIRPPWKIKVKGWVDENKWYLSVQDNGPGMDEEKEKELKRNMKKSLIEQNYEKSEIGGMGILNIYSRLVLVYGEDADLRIENKVESGLLVVIGGALDE